MGAAWPLVEFWKDNVAPLRKAMDQFTEPLVKGALAKREKQLSGHIETREDEETTLLAHLVKNTQGPPPFQTMETHSKRLICFRPKDPERPGKGFIPRVLDYETNRLNSL
jgi:hypothetical protein